MEAEFNSARAPVMLYPDPTAVVGIIRVIVPPASRLTSADGAVTDRLPRVMLPVPFSLPVPTNTAAWPPIDSIASSSLSRRHSRAIPVSTS